MVNLDYSNDYAYVTIWSSLQENLISRHWYFKSCIKINLIFTTFTFYIWCFAAFWTHAKWWLTTVKLQYGTTSKNNRNGLAFNQRGHDINVKLDIFELCTTISNMSGIIWYHSFKCVSMQKSFCYFIYLCRNKI